MTNETKMAESFNLNDLCGQLRVVRDEMLDPEDERDRYHVAAIDAAIALIEEANEGVEVPQLARLLMMRAAVWRAHQHLSNFDDLAVHGGAVIDEVIVAP